MDYSSHLQTAWVAGRARWLAVDLSYEEFERQVRAMKNIPAEEADERLALHGADVFLVAGCLAKCSAAFDLLEREFIAHIPSLVASIDRSSFFGAEVAQVIRERLLCPPMERLRDYSGAGPLSAWLRIAATRAAFDLKRRDGATLRRDQDLPTQILVTARDPEWELLRQRYREPVEGALRAAIADLEPRDRMILRLYLLGGENIEAIGRIYGVHRATVARWIVSAEKRILASVRLCLHQQLGIPEDDCESLARYLTSRLDLCLDSVL